MHPQDRLKLDMIERYGFCFNPVMTDKTTFVYTSGLFKTFGHPEIFVMGYQTHDACGLIGLVCERIKAGDHFADSMIIDDLYADSLYAIRPMLQCSTDENSGIGQRLVGYFPAVQLFFSDDSSLFPWDDGCDPRCKNLQTSIFEYVAGVPTCQIRSLKRN
jgi:hypothetical protein